LIRTRKKSIALFVTLIFVLGLMVPMTAFAANVKISSAYPIITDAAGQPAGWFRIVADDFKLVNQANWTTYVTVSLSSGAEFATELTTTALVAAQVATTVTGGAAVIARVSSSKTLVQFTVANAGGTVDTLQFNFPNLDIASGTKGDVTATVTLQALDNLNNQVWTQTNTVKIAQIGDAKLTATAKAAKKISGAGLAVKAANIEIAENQPGVLKSAPADTVTLTIATPNVTWAGAAGVWAAGPAANGTAGLTVAAAGPTVSANLKTLTYTINTSSAGIGGKLTFVLDPAAPATGFLNIAPGVSGDIVISVASSNTKLDATDLTVATTTAGEFTVVPKNVTNKEGVSGAGNVDIGDLEIEQNFAGAYAANGSLVFTLKNAKWAAAPAAPAGFTYGGMYNDDRSVWFSVTGAPATKVLFTTANVNLDANALGDITVELSGTAGPSGSYALGQAIAAATLYADKLTVNVNSLDQVAGDIKITEAKRNLFNDAGNLKLTLPNGIFFSKNPKLYINGTEETITWVGGTAARGTGVADIAAATFAGKLSTTTVDVIEIKNLAYDVDSRFAAKDIKVELAGTFLTGAAAGAKTTTVASIANAVGAVAGQVTKDFAVGDAGVAVVNGRTLVQVNLLCDVLGLQKSWDAATKTAYFVKAGKVVAFPMGENAIYINGVKVPVDQGGMIVSDFTYATLRGIQMAFGGELSWNNDTKTATFKF
jgi:hypothetical protein